jgi:1-aminocyclopropane-1-carboxylate synthase 1/2/6
VEVALDPLSQADGYKITVDSLEAGWRAAGGIASRIKMVLLSSPNNPTGEVLAASSILEIVEWTRHRQVHLAMDEIYALSVFSDSAFVSVAEVLDGELGCDVSIIWSMSKDFALSGCRVGVLYTKNEALLRTFMNLSYFASTSRHTQYALSQMLEDTAWLDSYVKESKSRLAGAYSGLTTLLDKSNVPYLPSSAGFFVYIDLRAWLKGGVTIEAEHALWKVLIDDAKVILTPAGQMLCEDFGWFRCCFAAHSSIALRTGWKRMMTVLEKYTSDK